MLNYQGNVRGIIGWEDAEPCTGMRTGRFAPCLLADLPNLVECKVPPLEQTQWWGVQWVKRVKKANGDL